MTGAYYNENDPHAAAWLRELINRGLIAPGDVDERSIKDVQGSDVAGFTQCHFFAGIGGWSLALRLAGWADDRSVWTGSCPCQPFSSAGKRKGNADDRHLWPEMFRLIRECRPVTIFGEQVEAAIRAGWLDGISADLEGEGYAVGSIVLGAHSVGAPHIRQRLWWVADTQRTGIWSGGFRADGKTPEGMQVADGERQRLRTDPRASGCNERLGMANSECSAGRQSSIGRSDDQRETGERSESTNRLGKCGAAIGLVNSDFAGSLSGKLAATSAGYGSSAVADGSTERLVNPNSSEETRQRSVGISLEPKQKTERSCHANAWTQSELIGCADSKSRRIESGSAPLAHGVPARVVRLRGYGNAIVPQDAAAFIEAFLEVGAA